MIRKIHECSIRSVKLGLFAETDAFMGQATGFLCTYKNKKYIVSNWHTFSGRNSETRKPIHKSLALPARIKYDLTARIPTLGRTDHYNHFKYSQSVRLDKDGVAQWLEHPLYGSNVDVAVLPLEEEIEGLSLYDIASELKAPADAEVMKQVFIVGFPLSETVSENSFPVYKSGTIATEPYVHGKLPRFFIDGKTKKGMSGSPVILRQNSKVWADDKNIKIVTERNYLVGVYSGRDREEDSIFEAELGIVWPIEDCLVPILEAA